MKAYALSPEFFQQVHLMDLEMFLARECHIVREPDLLCVSSNQVSEINLASRESLHPASEFGPDRRHSAQWYSAKAANTGRDRLKQGVEGLRALVESRLTD